jgi:hypothetical protein
MWFSHVSRTLKKKKKKKKFPSKFSAVLFDSLNCFMRTIIMQIPCMSFGSSYVQFLHMALERIIIGVLFVVILKA